jgi:hypothetical protein
MNTTIKKTLIMLVSGLLLTFNTQAKENPNTTTTIGLNVVKEIKNQITFPNFIQETNHTEEVKVVFTVNEVGKVNLVIANTNNTIFKQAIELQFLKLTLNQLKANHTYGIQFNFKTI